MRMRIALIAHDGRKAAMVALASEFREFLGRCQLCATGTTGGRLQAEVGLEVERLLSGPLGGDLQIGARLAVGEIDAVIFLRDQCQQRAAAAGAMGAAGRLKPGRTPGH